MININELRRLAQTVQSPAHNINERMDALHTLHNTLPSGVVLELLDRLEEAESDAIEQARLNGVGASREAALMAKLEAAEKERDNANAAAAGIALQAETLQAERDALRTELADLRSSMTFRTSLIGRIEAECDALRAKIEAMEQQKPVGTLHDDGYFVWSVPSPYESNYAGWKTKLYALPGAKGE